MVRTRAQGKVEDNGEAGKPTETGKPKQSDSKTKATKGGSKRKTVEPTTKLAKRQKEETEGPTEPAAKGSGPKRGGKRKTAEKEEEHEAESEREEDRVPEGESDKQAEKPASKKTKTAKAAEPKAKGQKKPAESTDKGPPPSKPKIAKLIEHHGQLPLSDMGLSDPMSPTPETILAHVMHAMLTSARISHGIAIQSVKCLIEAGYHDVNVLKKSSWVERTEVLTKGGYTHYREKTASQLSDLADVVLDEYNGDLNNLRKEANDDRDTIRNRIKAIKGFGNVGVDIFCDTAQAVWPCLAPFVDERGLKTADKIGLGADVHDLYEAAGKDPETMCKLSAALTVLRLDKKEKEFME